MVFGTHNLTSAPGLLERARTEGPFMEILDAPPPESGANSLLGPGAVRELPYAAWVNIQTGLRQFVRVLHRARRARARGQPPPRRHRRPRCELLARRGVTEVTLARPERQLLRPRHHQPATALRRRSCAPSVRCEGIGRVRFTSPHPKDLRPETIEAMAVTPEVCEQLHLPLQSGSDRVLRAMRRGYTAQRYLDRLAAARAGDRRPRRDHRHHRGFPGETAADFEDTLALCAEAGYDSAFTFIFSPRPGTRAAAMESEFVPADVVAERFDRLKTVIDRSALARHQARVGRSEEVLVEGVSRRDDAMLTGAHPPGQARALSPPRAPAHPRPGALCRVTVTAGHPHHLSGRLEEVTARPRHRVRIPVAGA